MTATATAEPTTKRRSSTGAHAISPPGITPIMLAAVMRYLLQRSDPEITPRELDEELLAANVGAYSYDVIPLLTKRNLLQLVADRPWTAYTLPVALRGTRANIEALAYLDKLEAVATGELKLNIHQQPLTHRKRTRK